MTGVDRGDGAAEDCGSSPISSAPRSSSGIFGPPLTNEMNKRYHVRNILKKT